MGSQVVSIFYFFGYYKGWSNKIPEDLFLDTFISLGITTMKAIAWHRVCAYLIFMIWCPCNPRIYFNLLVLQLSTFNLHYQSFCYGFPSHLSVGWNLFYFLKKGSWEKYSWVMLCATLVFCSFYSKAVWLALKSFAHTLPLEDLTGSALLSLNDGETSDPSKFFPL